ncbi:MAG TPA: NusA-like transcription termination signal-binding factor, partial [Thermoplasmatales archaeon]|nr:NusA-like transcription termination signal-binding factor [Thermoplasmatales archaeon]
MAEIVLSNETVQFINLASKYSGAGIRDCIVEDDRVVFIVEKGQLGIAIGSKAKNLERLRSLFKKSVKFVEFDEDKTRFVKNLCKPYEVKKVT